MKKQRSRRTRNRIGSGGVRSAPSGRAGSGSNLKGSPSLLRSRQEQQREDLAVALFKDLFREIRSNEGRTRRRRMWIRERHAERSRFIVGR